MCFVEPRVAILDRVVGNAPFWKIHKYSDDSVDSFQLFWGKKNLPAQDFHNIGITS